ncbi:LPS-assembly protein LptD, partial [bacterium]|nr:LPS-assembly protein LptD [bacterium]
MHFFLSFCIILAVCSPLFGAQSDVLSSAAIDSVIADSLLQPRYNSGFDTTLFYDARIIETALDSSCYYLRGDAVVRYQKMKLTAALITINQIDETITAEGLPDTSWVFNADSTAKTQKISMKGTPVFMEGSEDIKGFKLIYNYRTQKGRVIHGGSEYQTGKYTGAQIKKVSKNVFNVSDARFTSCDIEDHPHFYFKSRRLKMISNKEIIARPLVMYIADVPIAILPFVFYSNVRGRHSGLVIPTYGNSQRDGRYLRGLGYYWAPSDYFDARLKGNYYEKSGWMLDGLFRYNKRYTMNG